jgi:hypothetical protein
MFLQELFDYEVDSDDEWEEEEPGESLSASEVIHNHYIRSLGESLSASEVILNHLYQISTCSVRRQSVYIVNWSPVVTSLLSETTGMG